MNGDEDGEDINVGEREGENEQKEGVTGP